jgi:fibronectin type 3 domain-containing protein
LDVTWQDNASNADGYRIYRMTNNSGVFSLLSILAANATGYNDSGLTPGSALQYYVQAFNVAGYSGLLDIVTGTLTSPPTNPVATPGGGSVTLTWTASPGALSYNIYRSTTSGGEGSTPIATGIINTSFVDVALPAGITEYYWITAVDVTGESAPSPEVSATPTLFVIQVNFTGDGSTVPPGFVDDTGLAYQLQNSYLFGWNQDNTKNMRDRDSSSSPNEQQDTFALMQATSNPNASWTIAVPNGTYTVSLTAGDPTSINGNYEIDVNGILVVSGTPTGKNHWISGTVTITITNGQLTVSNASGAVNNKLDFITITQLTNTISTQLTNASVAGFGQTGATSVIGATTTPGATNGSTNRTEGENQNERLNWDAAGTDSASAVTAEAADEAALAGSPGLLPRPGHQAQLLGQDTIDALMAELDWSGVEGSHILDGPGRMYLM